MRVTNNYIGGHGINTANNPGGGYWDFAAIEIMGAASVVSGNYIYNWGFGVMDGQMNASPNPGWTCTNNIFVQVNTDITPEGGGTPPANSSGNRSYASLNSPGCPAPPPPPNGSVTFQVLHPRRRLARNTLGYVVSVFGTAQQPYITEVYANDDPAQANGYIAVELYNPYNSRHDDEQLAPGDDQPAIQRRFLARSAVRWPRPWTGRTTRQPSRPMDSSFWLVPTRRPPASADAPTQNSNSMVLVVPDLVTAFDQELVLLRPRRADGALQVHLDDQFAGRYIQRGSCHTRQYAGLRSETSTTRWKIWGLGADRLL